MSVASSQDKERRINLSINRLIAQVAPPPNTLSEDETQSRVEWYTGQIRTVFQKYYTRCLCAIHDTS